MLSEGDSQGLGMDRRAVLSVSLGVSVLIASGRAQACSCTPLPTPEEAAQQADAVFLGTVERFVEVIQRASPEMTGLFGKPQHLEWRRRQATLTVKTVWKGSVGPLVDVVTGMGAGDCGYEFVVDQEYLVYAYRDETRLMTDLCTRTRPSAGAAFDLAVLSGGTAVGPPDSSGLR